MTFRGRARVDRDAAELLGQLLPDVAVIFPRKRLPLFPFCRNSPDRRQDPAFDFAEADAVAVAVCVSADGQRVAIFKPLA